ncbi:MAG: TRAP transporter small permease [Cytophagales bacterium]|nr:TRAP transporter small permease [Cytophagales bacterium]MDW8384675.1 TRAP transporter small permease [Flammeovirgaceae bacterium]
MRELITKILGKFLIFLMGAMVVNVTWQVISRFLAQAKIIAQPSSVTDELAGFMLIWLGLLGASYATAKDMHLAIDILPQKANDTQRRVYHLIIQTCTFLFAFTVMVIGGINLVYMTFILGQKSPTLKVPMGYIYLIVPISGILICYYSLHALANEFLNKAKK